MKPLSTILAVTVFGAALALPAAAEMDYHGFKPETIDALNEKLETPLTEEALAVLSSHTDIEACGGSNSVAMNPPEGWGERVENANPPGGDVVMPVPTSALAPEYPAVYEILGVEGVCKVMFNVSDSGATENVMTNCTLSGFDTAARDVIEPLEFTAAEGQSSPATPNILLPINFCRPDKEEG